ncbi:MAG: hypothetical protein LC797_05045 [Chloroflexi bacterium]|nr:hypothetical protein [Chloroflexota bacterium]
MARIITVLATSAALAVAALVTPALVGSAAEWVVDAQVAGYSGALLYLDRGQIWRLDLQTQQRSQLVQSPDSGYITHVAHSMDHGHIVYATTHVTPEYWIADTEIVVAGADGSDPRVVVHEDRKSFAATWPAWNNDGTRIAYTLANTIDATQRSMEVDLTTGRQEVVIEGGSAATISPDGKAIVYDYWSGSRWTIWSRDRASGQDRQLVAENWFIDSDVPLFAPDGSSLLFVAAGAGPTRAGHPLPTWLGAITSLLAPVAEAHQIPDPFDLWSMRPDGSAVARLAPIRNVQAFPTWSPDGRFVATWGLDGLQIVDAASGAVQLLSVQPNVAPISWSY